MLIWSGFVIMGAGLGFVVSGSFYVSTDIKERRPRVVASPGVEVGKFS